MRKIIWSLISIVSVVSIPLVANADAAYNQFRKKQIQEFKGDKAPENCLVKKLEVTESGNKLLYELCAVKGKPMYLRASSGDITYAFYEFKKGKLVQVTNVDHFTSIGFRNEQPVVQWNSLDKTVNYKLSAEMKKGIQQDVAKIKKIISKIRK